MSSDDFGTINVNRGERAREIEVLRQHYRQHRDSLQRMMADAPTEHLATEYQRLVAEIDRALAKLDELEGIAAPVTAPPQHELSRPHGDPLAAQRPRPASTERATEPGMRPLATPPRDLADPPTIPPGEVEPASRLPLIIGAAVLALALIGWLIYRASGGRNEGTAIVEERPAVTTTTAADTGTTAAEDTDTIAPAQPRSSAVTATPASHDYGVVRKGTRATRQFEIANTTDDPMTIQVARSTCRCLFYEHAPVIPPKAKESLTVTVDGGRAKPGELREQIRITSKADPSLGTTINVNATIR
jgi:hypothetical protein